MKRGVMQEQQIDAQPDSASLPQPPESRQFDFWLGTWDLSWGDNQKGTNRIEALLDGQVIQENFDGQPSILLKGISYSTYDATLKKWRQTWIDNEGGYIVLTGEFANDQMLLVTERQLGETTTLFRMIFYNIRADSLDWSWERSADGQTWQPVWKIHYQKRDAK